MWGTRLELAHSRSSALGAALAVVLGCGGLMPASAEVSSGDRGVFVPIAPCRVVDTRPAPDTVGIRTSPLGPGEPFTVAIRGLNGACDIPADAIGVSVNLAAIAPTADSFLTLYPSDVARPVAANLNVIGGQAPVSNAATVRIGADGSIVVFNLAGSVHVAIDVTGYFVGHTHDDRYYTKAETDAKVAGVLAPGVITNAMIADNAITSAKVQNGTLSDADIKDNSITTFDLADNSVDADEVLDFGLTNEDIGVLYAQVNADGSLASSSGGAASSRIGVGTYQVDFGHNVSACAFVAGLGSSGTNTALGQISAVDRGGNLEAVYIETYDSAGADADRAFQLVVVC